MREYRKSKLSNSDNMDKFIVKRPRLELVEGNSCASVSATANVPSTISTSDNTQHTDTKSSKISTIRKFKSDWLVTYTWLSYDEHVDKAYCKTCRQADDQQLLEDAKFVKGAFIQDGFSDWKHAIERFKGHEKSDSHRAAVLKTAYVAAGHNVASGLSKAKREEMLIARAALCRIVTSIAFLSKQGLAIRGKTDASSNFQQLLLLRSGDSGGLQRCLARSRNKWISHDIQNEILQLLSDDVLRRIISEIRQAQYYSLMIDETMDCSRHEQLVICFRYCDSQLEIHELFTGFHELEHQDAETLFKIVNDILLRFNVDLNNCSGQCYDGAANVAGSLNGLQSRIREAEPRAMFVHCTAHSINLVVQDAVASVPAYRDILSMFGALINFVRDSPKRLRWFESLQRDGTTAPAVLSNTMGIARVGTQVCIVKLRRTMDVLRRS